MTDATEGGTETAMSGPEGAVLVDPAAGPVVGALRKMRAEPGRPARYRLPVGAREVGLNELVGRPLRLRALGTIHCIHCGRKTSKSFSQGYCYPCFRSLAQCDSCIVKPEQCHYFEGTCREPEWGEQHCMRQHFVYLANSSGLKVGITRGSQLPTRWLDQGAVQALPIFRVETRQQSGFVEVLFKDFVGDRTNWRAMLKGEIQPLDLIAERARLLAHTTRGVRELQNRFGLQAIQPVTDSAVEEFHYPVLEYPTKVSSLNLDKQPEIAGTLMGVKGQYLIFDTGVINIRKYAGYQVELTIC